MTTIHASRPLDVPTITRPAPAPARVVAPEARAAQDSLADDLTGDWPADHEPAAPAASVLTAGLSLVAVLAVCAGAAVLVGFAFRAVLGFFAG